MQVILSWTNVTGVNCLKKYWIAAQAARTLPSDCLLKTFSRQSVHFIDDILQKQ